MNSTLRVFSAVSSNKFFIYLFVPVPCPLSSVTRPTELNRQYAIWKKQPVTVTDRV